MREDEWRARQVDGLYPYKWSLNVSINPFHWLNVAVWFRERCFEWTLRYPLRIGVSDS